MGILRTALQVKTIAGRELVAYFLSPVAWVVLFLFVFSNGLLFNQYARLTEGDPRQIDSILRQMFGFAFVWILPLSPLLTMRLFAEEKRNGTLEMLMTAPVTAFQVVLGKFLAAQLFYMAVWSTLLLFCLVLEVLGTPSGPDWGPVLAIYVGLFFLGCLTNALGLFASSVSRNQLVAAILALTGNLLLFSLVLGSFIWPESIEARRFFHYVSFSQHFKSEYTNGVIDLRYPIYYLTLSALFLYFTTWIVEVRKWR